LPSIGHWKNYIRALSSIDCVASNAFQEDNLPFEACTLTHEAVLQYRRCRGRRGVGQEQLLLKMRQGGVRSQVDSLDTGHRQPTPGQLVLYNKSTSSEGFLLTLGHLATLACAGTSVMRIIISIKFFTIGNFVEITI
jgi:hypothetical protein